jgi:hypothetical protein
LKIKFAVINTVLLLLVLSSHLVAEPASLIQKWLCHPKGFHQPETLPQLPSTNVVNKAPTLRESPEGNEFDVVLASGGSTGFYLVAHQESVQNVATDFHALIFVRDQIGYSWMVLPELHTHLVGAGKAYCGAQFDIPEFTAKQMLDAEKNGAQFAVVVAAAHSREHLLKNLRKAFGERISNAAAKFLNGYITADRFLSTVNAGLSPVGGRARVVVPLNASPSHTYRPLSSAGR